MKAGERLGKRRGLLAKGFVIGEMKVSNAQFKKLMDNNIIQRAQDPECSDDYYELTEKGKTLNIGGLPLNC